MLIHLTVCVFQGVETSGTCVGTSVCLCCFRELSVRHVCWYTSGQGVETSDTCVGTPQSVCVVSGS